MKKVLIGSALAVGLLFSSTGVSPASASSVGAGINSVNLQSIQGMDIETALLAVQTQRANLLEEQLKDQIADVQQNNQQMDMLRLQSLSNKRNEAVDVMSNFIKKMQDSRSSIIGNMR